ncbi:hypothetical protein BD560DRAFT_232647 [Blakeslea trispora]|nr:hypothetical protein BD560DRAFT_232647 [Blakeslea trispora]
MIIVFKYRLDLFFCDVILFGILAYFTALPQSMYHNRDRQTDIRAGTDSSKKEKAYTFKEKWKKKAIGVKLYVFVYICFVLNRCVIHNFVLLLVTRTKSKLVCTLLYRHHSTFCCVFALKCQKENYKVLSFEFVDK